LSILKPRDIAELKLEFRDQLVTKISQKVRPQILLYKDPVDSIREKVRELNFPGVEITDKDIMVYPEKIKDPASYARLLAPVVGIEEKRLTSLLEGKIGMWCWRLKLNRMPLKKFEIWCEK